MTVLFVSNPSAQADRTEAVLGAQGVSVIRADNICVAEMYAEAQYFEAAVYDQSLSHEEQASLAGVMRIRWPWMRIVRWTSPDNPLHDDSLFDCTAHSESQLASCLASALAR